MEDRLSGHSGSFQALEWSKLSAGPHVVLETRDFCFPAGTVTKTVRNGYLSNVKFGRKEVRQRYLTCTVSTRREPRTRHKYSSCKVPAVHQKEEGLRYRAKCVESIKERFGIVS